jgi:peptidyl-prolyl cis-trans isomerase C
VTVSVNGVAVDAAPWPSAELAAVRELLRQRAIACGLLADGAADEAAVSGAIEKLLEQEVTTPEPTEPECRRYYDAHSDSFRSGDLVLARHILFQVTQGAPIAQIRARAEQVLGELLAAPDRFGDVAREMSNCPSGQHGGNLGQVSRGEMVPEFDKALFGPGPTGIYRQLVKTRYGFHIVAVDRRIPGAALPFEAARPRIAERLQATVQQRALRQYVSVLAGQAQIEGVDLGASASPLVQ